CHGAPLKGPRARFLPFAVPDRGRPGQVIAGINRPCFQGVLAVNTLDFSPLFRTAIGFARLARQLESARSVGEAQSYPPYNVEKTGEDSYVLTMAVAGFGPGDIEVVARENVLTV